MDVFHHLANKTTKLTAVVGGHKLQINMPRYSDIQSWIGGLVEIMFFLDFLNYRSGPEHSKHCQEGRHSTDCYRLQGFQKDIIREKP